MTEQQIIETLAAKVMGWQRKKDDYVDWWMHEDVFICRVDEWNPLQNIHDAWMIVDKFKEIRPIHETSRHNFQALFRGSIYDITPELICKTALKVI